MDKFQFENQWPQLRRVIRDRWSNLTEEDINQISRFDQLISRIAQRYNLAREEAEDQFNTWAYERGFIKGQKEAQESFAESESSYKWLILAGIPLLLAAGYFLHDLTRPTERSFAKPVVMTQSMPYAAAPGQEVTPDAMLINRIRQAINTGNLPASFANLTIDSSNGTVTIRGKVSSQAEKDLVSKVIERIAGVNKVDNQLEVQ